MKNMKEIREMKEVKEMEKMEKMEKMDKVTFEMAVCRLNVLRHGIVQDIEKVKFLNKCLKDGKLYSLKDVASFIGVDLRYNKSAEEIHGGYKFEGTSLNYLYDDACNYIAKIYENFRKVVEAYEGAEDVASAIKKVNGQMIGVGRHLSKLQEIMTNVNNVIAVEDEQRLIDFERLEEKEREELEELEEVREEKEKKEVEELKAVDLVCGVAFIIGEAAERMRKEVKRVKRRADRGQLAEVERLEVFKDCYFSNIEGYDNVLSSFNQLGHAYRRSAGSTVVINDFMDAHTYFKVISDAIAYHDNACDMVERLTEVVTYPKLVNDYYYAIIRELDRVRAFCYEFAGQFEKDIQGQTLKNFREYRRRVDRARRLETMQKMAKELREVREELNEEINGMAGKSLEEIEREAQEISRYLSGEGSKDIKELCKEAGSDKDVRIQELGALCWRDWGILVKEFNGVISDILEQKATYKALGVKENGAEVLEMMRVVHGWGR